MDEEDEAGFREVDHTADRQVEVWAPEISGLLEEAAKGMYEVTRVQLGSEVQVTRRFRLDHPDRETMLVGFLSELLFMLQTEHLAFDRFTLKFEEQPEKSVSVLAVGQPVSGIEQEIKAVTWHALSVEQNREGYRARVTFDV